MSGDPYRVLQVDRAACSQVIEAAFRALRELVLSDGSEEAPGRLAELNRAHRALSDPQAREALDRRLGVRG